MVERGRGDRRDPGAGQDGRAVALAKLSGVEPVNWALGHAAVYGRFAEADQASIIAHRASVTAGDAQQASEDHSLQAGTGAWKEFGR